MIDTHANCIVAHPTLPKYREKPIEVTANMPEAGVSISDNFLRVIVQADTDAAAAERASRVCDRVLLAISRRTTQHLHARFVGASNNDENRPLHQPMMLRLGRWRMYDLTALEAGIRTALSDCARTDDALERASAYFYHALFLADILDRERTDSFGSSFHVYYLLGEATLHFHKAVSAILGDPSSDRDYQSRFRLLGMSRDLWERAETMRKARNDHDIAHYSATPQQMDTMWKNFHAGHEVATAVLKAYADRSTQPS